jgi:hypothetical protein
LLPQESLHAPQGHRCSRRRLLLAALANRGRQAFFRKYQGMSDQGKKRLRQILDAWERDP